MKFTPSRDHNATSYSTETYEGAKGKIIIHAEIITLRAIALKRNKKGGTRYKYRAEIITLRAIALKPDGSTVVAFPVAAEIITLRAIALKPHRHSTSIQSLRAAEIITLRAIALKHKFNPLPGKLMLQRS